MYTYLQSLSKTPSVYFYLSTAHRSLTVTRIEGIIGCYNFCTKEFTNESYYSCRPFPQTKKHIDHLYTGVYATSF